MPDYPKPIGRGGIWEKQGKKGHYLSGELKFQYEKETIKIKFIAFKNDRKQGKQPDFNIIVNDWEYDQPPDPVEAPPKEETWDPATDDLPF